MFCLVCAPTKVRTKLFVELVIWSRHPFVNVWRVEAKLSSVGLLLLFRAVSKEVHSLGCVFGELLPNDHGYSYERILWQTAVQDKTRQRTDFLV